MARGTSFTQTFNTLGIITPPVLPTGNRQPVTQNDSASTAAGTAVNNINVLGNDTDAAVFIDFTGASPAILPAAQSRQLIAPNATAASIGIPSANPFGSAAFSATRTTGTSIIFSQQQSDGSHVNRVAVRRGDSAVNGTTWQSFRDPVMNREDVAVWLGEVAGSTSIDDDVIAVCTPAGTPVVAAREGISAPGTAAVFHASTSIALPDGASGPIISAVLRIGSGGGTTANDTGLWATASDGSLMLVLREGDAFGTRIVKKFQALESIVGSPGQSRRFNAAREVITLLTFTDGSQSLVQVAIP